MNQPPLQPDASSSSRSLNLSGAPNCRDVGGYVTVDGLHVRWERVFRSAELSRLTPADAAAVDALHVEAVIDLRTAAVIENYQLTERLVPPAAGQPAPVGGAPQVLAAIAQLPAESRIALWRSDPAYLLAALDSIKREYGSVDAYVERGLGLSRRQVEHVRRALLQ
jgi:hypothetical protein